MTRWVRLRTLSNQQTCVGDISRRHVRNNFPASSRFSRRVIWALSLSVRHMLCGAFVAHLWCGCGAVVVRLWCVCGAVVGRLWDYCGARLWQQEFVSLCQILRHFGCIEPVLNDSLDVDFFGT